MKNVNLPATVSKIKAALICMDINALRILIDEDVYTFGTTKEIFLDRLAFIFNEYKLSHDHQPPVIIQSEKNPNAFKLKFKKLEAKVKFIVEESGGKITCIYNNNEATTKDDVDFLSPYDMIFGDDETPEFSPSGDYLLNLEKSKDAIARLDGSERQVFNSSELRLWLKEFQDLGKYTSLNFKYFKFNRFNDFYFSIELIINDLELVEIASRANRDIKKMTIGNWHKKYNRLYYCNLMGFDQSFHHINFHEQIIQFRWRSNAWFTGQDFFELISFCLLYDGYSTLLRINEN